MESPSFDPAPAGHPAVGISTSCRVTVASNRSYSLGAWFALYRAARPLWRGPSEYRHGRPESGFPHFLFCHSMSPMTLSVFCVQYIMGTISGLVHSPHHSKAPSLLRPHYPRLFGSTFHPTDAENSFQKFQRKVRLFSSYSLLVRTDINIRACPSQVETLHGDYLQTPCCPQA